MARTNSVDYEEKRKLLRVLCGEFLKKLRIQKNLSLRDISTALEFDTHTFIHAIESGGPSLPEEHWNDYAKILNVDVSWLTKNLLMYYKPHIYSSLYGKPTKHQLENGVEG